MLLELINLNPDLKRLKDEGYQLEVYKNYLLIHNIPYVTNEKQIKFGILVSTLNLSGNRTIIPETHESTWIGDAPCDPEGNLLSSLILASALRIEIDSKLIITHSFSQKPIDKNHYKDYYEKMTSYICMIENNAKAVDPNVTSKTFSDIPLEGESVFNYYDTSSSRSNIVSINEKLRQEKIAIIGLGGTGSFILDLVAKTLVKEIHLFDNDEFLQHNAFRCPGAFSLEELQNHDDKVNHFTKVYSKLRQNVIPHNYDITESNLSELDSMNMVFISIDDGLSRKIIVSYLLKKKISFIDAGIGLMSKNNAITGLLRVTTCTFNNISAKEQLPFNDSKEDEYSNNIQIADMNALNGILAVIKWKKISGFYHDLKQECNTIYDIFTNDLTNEYETRQDKI